MHLFRTYLHRITYSVKSNSIQALDLQLSMKSTWKLIPPYTAILHTYSNIHRCYSTSCKTKLVKLPQVSHKVYENGKNIFCSSQKSIWYARRTSSWIILAAKSWKCATKRGWWSKNTERKSWQQFCKAVYCKIWFNFSTSSITWRNEGQLFLCLWFEFLNYLRIRMTKILLHILYLEVKSKNGRPSIG